MSVEQFSEFDWRESKLVIVLELFTSLSRDFISSGSHTGVIGVMGVSGTGGDFGTRFPLLTSSIAFRSCFGGGKVEKMRWK
jgi:hypothetical protein